MRGRRCMRRVHDKQNHKQPPLHAFLWCWCGPLSKCGPLVDTQSQCLRTLMRSIHPDKQQATDLRPTDVPFRRCHHHLQPGPPGRAMRRPKPFSIPSRKQLRPVGSMQHMVAVLRRSSRPWKSNACHRKCQNGCWRMPSERRRALQCDICAKCYDCRRISSCESPRLLFSSQSATRVPVSSSRSEHDGRSIEVVCFQCEKVAFFRRSDRIRLQEVSRWLMWEHHTSILHDKYDNKHGQLHPAVRWKRRISIW